MAGMNNIGWLYPKKASTVQISADADWEVVAAVAIPPYVVCEQYWLNCTAVASSTTETYKTQALGVKGIYFPVSPNQDPDEDDVLSIVKEYCPPDPDEWSDGDTNADLESDLPGQMPVGTTFQNSQFFNRERIMGIADGQSLITSADGDPPTGDLTYVDRFTTKGNPYRKSMGMKMDDAKYMVFLARTEQDWSDNDMSTSVSGNPGTFQAFTEIIYNTFGVNTDGGVSEHVMGLNSINSNLQAWLTKGYHDTDHSTAKAMMVNTRLSLKCKVVLPRGARHISGG